MRRIIRDGRVQAVLLIIVLVVAGFEARWVHNSNSGAPATPTEPAAFSREACESQAPAMVRKFPTLYADETEYVQVCMSGRAAADRLENNQRIRSQHP